MKVQVISKLAALAVVLGVVAGPATAAVVDATVGSLDTRIDYTRLDNSGFGTEQAWVQGILGSGYSLTGKYEPIDENLWHTVVGHTDRYAIRFADLDCAAGGTCSTEPEYFLLKLGIPGWDTWSPDTYLFRNEVELGWAVVEFAQFLNIEADSRRDWTMNIGRVSHFSVDGRVPVPAPATLALLGLGALGLGLARRRKQ